MIQQQMQQQIQSMAQRTVQTNQKSYAELLRDTELYDDRL